ncbi:MAG: hypothetical protein MUF15_26590 [Acidobacteria bacterium]|jgi:hypothetical protein|nr:hypothetical protein [Acidobacteriota bacterium]
MTSTTGKRRKFLNNLVLTQYGTLACHENTLLATDKHGQTRTKHDIFIVLGDDAVMIGWHLNFS